MLRRESPLPNWCLEPLSACSLRPVIWLNQLKMFLLSLTISSKSTTTLPWLETATPKPKQSKPRMPTRNGAPSLIIRWGTKLIWKQRICASASSRREGVQNSILATLDPLKSPRPSQKLRTILSNCPKNIRSTLKSMPVASNKPMKTILSSSLDEFHLSRPPIDAEDNQYIVEAILDYRTVHRK